MKEVAVIIPFFQEQSGILPKAIASALAQPLPDGVSLWIIIIDDQSPITAEREIEDIKIPSTVRLTVRRVEQNGGPGAARNIGLDVATAGGATYCAFLDSDDTWVGAHLSNAVKMINEGAGAYFSDHCRPGDYDSAFINGTPIFWNSPTVREKVSNQEEARDGSCMFTLDGTFVRNSLVFEYLFQTSTVVFLISAVGHVRFDTRLKSAGEDHLFWFDVATSIEKFAVCTDVEVECGFGVNVYFGSFSWKSPRSVGRFGYRFIMFKEMESRGLLGERERAQVQTEGAKMRNTYAYLLMRHMLRGTSPDWSLLRLVTSNTLRRIRH